MTAVDDVGVAEDNLLGIEVDESEVIVEIVVERAVVIGKVTMEVAAEDGQRLEIVCEWKMCLI